MISFKATTAWTGSLYQYEQKAQNLNQYFLTNKIIRPETPNSDTALGPR